MGLIDEFFQKGWDFFSNILGNTFNTEFWSLIGYTGIAAAGAFAVAYFFPVLRGFCGAVLMGVAGAWYGFHKGQKSRGD